jgi:malate dehydrogenase (oxaloacetate-decarboxylating)
MNSAQAAMAKITNSIQQRGSLTEIIKGKDVFIGVSAPKIVTANMVASMAPDSIVFAMANPIPEIMPEEAKAGGARIICTGRSDYPNQVNNVLVFPGLFKGALLVEAKQIVEEMKIAAAKALASLISELERTDDYIIPDPFDLRVAETIANEVATVAEELGIARKPRQK